VTLRAHAIPKIDQVLLVWSTSLESADFDKREVKTGSATYYGTNLDHKFKAGMVETLAWMKRKGYEALPGHINFVFQSNGKPWAQRPLQNTLTAKAEEVLKVRRFSIVSRAWQLVQSETDVNLKPPEPGMSAGTVAGVAVGKYGLPDGLEVSFLARHVAAEIPTCWERILEVQ